MSASLCNLVTIKYHCEHKKADVVFLHFYGFKVI